MTRRHCDVTGGLKHKLRMSPDESTIGIVASVVECGKWPREKYVAVCVDGARDVKAVADV